MVWFARSTAADESHTYRSRTPSEKKNHLALAKYVQTVDDSIASLVGCREACVRVDVAQLVVSGAREHNLTKKKGKI